MPALALAGGAIVSGVINGVASHNAADASAAGYQKAMTAANGQQQQSYNQIRTDENPFLTAGTGAVNTLASGLAPGGNLVNDFKPSDLTTDPGYQFRLDQGTQALQRSAAAKGGLLTGGTAKDLTTFAQGTASQEYGDAFNRSLQQNQANVGNLFSLAGIGQNANTTLANAGENEANSMDKNYFTGYTGQGDAKAAGDLGVGNAASGAVNGLVSSYLYSKGTRTPTMNGGTGVVN